MSRLKPLASVSPTFGGRPLRMLALAAVAPLSLLCVASVFGMQASLPALSHAWAQADASLPLLALGALFAGPLLALSVRDCGTDPACMLAPRSVCERENGGT
ncbi:hypothetical protein MNJPNG_24650 [Cupriavidus oxalaticus]